MTVLFWYIRNGVSVQAKQTGFSVAMNFKKPIYNLSQMWYNFVTKKVTKFGDPANENPI